MKVVKYNNTSESIQFTVKIAVVSDASDAPTISNADLAIISFQKGCENSINFVYMHTFTSCHYHHTHQ